MHTEASPNSDVNEMSQAWKGFGRLCWSRKWLILAVWLVTAVATFFLANLLSPSYTATGNLLVTSSRAGGMSAGLPGNLQDLIAIQGPGKADTYVGILRSRSVLEKVAKRLNLEQYYESRYFTNTLIRLSGATEAKAGRNGILSITVNDRNPRLAAAIVNAYIDALIEVQGRLALSEASRRRLFLQRQLGEVRNRIAELRRSTAQSLNDKGVFQVEEKTRSQMEMTGRLRAQVTQAEIGVKNMAIYAAPDNPELLAAQRQLATLRATLAGMEGRGGGSGAASAPSAGAARSGALFDDPTAAGMAAVESTGDLVMDIKYYETLQQGLFHQLETARLDEANDAPAVQVLDPAVVPELEGPKRLIAALSGLLIGPLLGVLLAWLRGLPVPRGGADALLPVPNP